MAETRREIFMCARKSEKCRSGGNDDDNDRDDRVDDNDDFTLAEANNATMIHGIRPPVSYRSLGDDVCIRRALTRRLEG